MRKNVRHIAIIACMALPLGLFASSERPNETSGDKDKREGVKAEKRLDRLAKKIRREVAKDGSLQPSSRDIEVTVQNRVVSLKGTVQSEEESQAIQGKAESLVLNDTPWDLAKSAQPEAEIENDLTVAPNQR
jgi:BON domain